MSSSQQKMRKFRYVTSTYDRDFFLRKRGKWPAFKKLKLATVLYFFRKRRSFQNIKRVALDRLEKTIYDQLDILMLADSFNYTEIEDVSQNIFSWRKKDFMKRRMNKKTIWVDVLKVIAKKDLLVRFKIRTDLNEIKALIKTFFDSIRNLNEFDMAAFDEQVNEPMREIQKFVNIYEDLQEEKLVLIKKYKDAKIMVNTRMYYRSSAHQESLLEEKEEAVVNARAWVPIEMRYQISWYATGVSMLELKKTLMEKSMTKCIQQLQFDTEVEATRGSSLNDICHDLSEAS
ncbi:hypothetical protein DOY81_006381 [Sarcophaga bullata]|nr:hypothetical protein DOY81_006381 [Sarcophaga bullata]